MTTLEIAVILAVALQVADVVTTNRGLARGKTESNAVVRALMRIAGDGWWIVKAGLACALLWWLAHGGYEFALWGLNALMALVVANNIRVLRRR